MRGKKRFIIFLFAILTVVAVIISSNVIFNHLQNEQEIISNYERKRQRYELLKDIATESIQEGIGIDTRKISKEVQYRIYNDNESIIFYYYLPDDSRTGQYRYNDNATITLSNEYKILKEEYSIEIESFDKYVKTNNLKYRCMSVMMAILSIIALYLLIYVFVALKKMLF